MHLGNFLGKQRVLVVGARDALALALRLMIGARLRHLPVVQDGRVVGVVTERDVLRRHAEVGSQAAALEWVEDVMTKPPITVRATDEVATAQRIMLDRGVGCLPLLGAEDELVGIVTRSDLLRADLQADPRPASPPDSAAMLMQKQPLTAAASDHLFDALARMEGRGVRHLPVVDGDRRVIGMLSDRDVRTAVGNQRDDAGPRPALTRLRELRVEDVMSRDPFVVPADASFNDLVSVFVDQKVGAVPVVDASQRLVGIISYVDVLRNAGLL